MTVRFEVRGLPPDLEPGTYGSRVLEAKWQGEDLLIVTEFTGLQGDRLDVGPFPITKHADLPVGVDCTGYYGPEDKS